jgi:hypothetical protein
MTILINSADVHRRQERNMLINWRDQLRNALCLANGAMHLAEVQGANEEAALVARIASDEIGGVLEELDGTIAALSEDLEPEVGK